MRAYWLDWVTAEVANGVVVVLWATCSTTGGISPGVFPTGCTLRAESA